MSYYYDIVLNFNEDNYKFYEVDKNDIFESVKKIPIFKVSHKVFKDILINKIQVNEEFLNKIYNKCTLSKTSLEYACLFSDKNNVIAVEFDKYGKSITKSCLPIQDELNILDTSYTLNKYNLDYSIISREKINHMLRKEFEIKRFITLEIEKLYKEKSISKLEFLYLEWFNKYVNDLKTIRDDMLSELSRGIDKKTEKIYELVKKSYTKV